MIKFENNTIIIPWEYRTVFFGALRGKAAEDELNAWGKEGWELISVDGNAQLAYFKRKKT